MFSIPCRCGLTTKSFRFNIGKTFRNNCCEKVESKKVKSKGKIKKSKAVEAPLDPGFSKLADLNDDGVVDEKDAKIVLDEIVKQKTADNSALDFLDE